MRNLIIAVVLLALFITELCFHYLPRGVHEILGVVTTIIVLVHVAINYRRFLTAINKMSLLRLVFVEINLALILGMVIILLSGLCMSNYLFPDLVNPTLRRNMTIHNLHTATPYVMTALIGIHIGLHWQEINQRVLKLLGTKKLPKALQTLFNAVILILSLLGVLGLFLNRFFDRISMEHIFATPATDLTAVGFILLIIGSVVLFAVITLFVVEKLFKE